jgi:hypothetical protein
LAVTTQKDGKTRRSILIQVAAAAAAVSGGATAVQAQARVADMTVRKILAVAVGGDSDRTLNIDKNNSSAVLPMVRPYITGLIEWLNDPTVNTDLDATPKTFPLGDNSSGYTIAYREVTMANLNVANPDVFSLSNLKGIDCIVCMSTFVGEKAAVSTITTPDIPIVVITSDPSNNKFGQNVCGVSAIRPQLTGGHGLHEFKKRSGLTKIYGLNRVGYNPSEQAKKTIGKGIPSTRWVDVNDDDTNFLTKISALIKTNAGLLVMPVDRFFGYGDQIVAAAAPMPTYWSTTDWPKTLKGGYGYPQRVCGQYMAQRVASIWSSTSGIDIPDEPFLTVDPKEVKSVYNVS